MAFIKADSPQRIAQADKATAKGVGKLILKLIVVLAATGLFTTGAMALTPDVGDAVLRRVADAVLKQSSRQLIDRSTGQRFEVSTGLPPKPEISIESKFNAWFYQTWLLADGMRRTASVLNEPKYRDYGERNLDFIYQHMPFFEQQHAAKMVAAPIGDGRASPIGYYFQINALWQTGLVPLVQERFSATKDARYKPFLARVTKFLSTSPRFDDGTLYRKDKGMMTDDPYMTVPFMIRQWNESGDEGQLKDAVQQILGTQARLLDQKVGLFRHLWDLKTQQPAGVFWGRGNGWMVLAQVELLAALPHDHPRRAEVLAAFVQHMEGIRRCQDKDGGWHQVLDHPESWIETSGTGMLTYGLARGVNEGWLDASFAEAARKGWKALDAKVTADGDLVDVCGSTDTGDLAYYMKRPRLKGDLHGFGSVLLAGAEVIRMNSTH